jgi:leader peptidase (prepilin peptidase)/N-methyltransferase
MTPSWLPPILIAPAIGSFLGVLVRRLPRGEPFAWSRSRCDSCGRTLSAAEMIPLASYAIQRGRCRGCGAAIGAFHPAIELAALGLAIWAATLDEGLRLWADCVFGWILLALAWIDWEHMILPDLLTLPLILAGLGWTWWVEPDALPDHAIGAVAGWALFAALAFAYRRLRGRDGLGEGDAKLLAAAGAWVGWPLLGSVILIGAFSGLGVATVQALRGRAMGAATAIPFGPCLALGAWLAFLYLL